MYGLPKASRSGKRLRHDSKRPTALRSLRRAYDALLSAVLAVVIVAETWAERMRQRREFASLSDRELRDFGASRYDALMESDKPFWRP